MKSLKGQLLIATPALTDPNFNQTVLLMVEHGEGGAMGLILNRKTDAVLADALEALDDPSINLEVPLCVGGPCQGPLMVLHTDAGASDAHVIGDVHFSTEREHVESLLRNGHEPAMYFVGYAGWAPGQLEAELKQNAWLTMSAKGVNIFDMDQESWAQLAERLSNPARPAGLDRAILPDDPSVN
ncbi:YqgE/AlgH family protein [Planctomycetales bacterium ZRK34]|nr:YqgE/AlgH family protein [Planctomycetales bacterium ZRK34]